MLLALDIGNTSVKGGFFKEEQYVSTFLVPTDPTDWEHHLREHLVETPFSRAVICSVVPSLNPAVAALVADQSGIEPLLITHQLRLPFELAYATPETLGADRLTAAAAAYVQYGEPQQRSVVVIDAGTTVTYEVVSREGVYLGGVIGPGLELLAQSLHNGAAQLPPVVPRPPSSPIGRSTREALETGIWFAFVDSVTDMIIRLDQTLGDAPLLIATGGNSDLLAKAGVSFHHQAPQLVLRGAALLARLNP